MTVEGDWNTVVLKRRVPLGNHRAAMARNLAQHWISLASHADTGKFHRERT